MKKKAPWPWLVALALGGGNLATYGKLQTTLQFSNGLRVTIGSFEDAVKSIQTSKEVCSDNAD